MAKILLELYKNAQYKILTFIMQKILLAPIRKLFFFNHIIQTKRCIYIEIKYIF